MCHQQTKFSVKAYFHKMAASSAYELRVFEVKTSVATSKKPDWRDLYKSDETVFEGEIVSAIQRVLGFEGMFYYRLEDGRGWIYEELEATLILSPVELQNGLFVMRVVNEAGLRLRSAPDFQDNERKKFRTDVDIVSGCIIECTLRVRGRYGDWFYRYESGCFNPSGWLFESRWGEQTMIRLNYPDLYTDPIFAFERLTNKSSEASLLDRNFSDQEIEACLVEKLEEVRARINASEDTSINSDVESIKHSFCVCPITRVRTMNCKMGFCYFLSWHLNDSLFPKRGFHFRFSRPPRT